MSNPAELTTLENFTNILERLGIDYAIAGSLASSTYGAVRFTEDADISVEPFDEHAEELLESLKGDYYVSKDAMYQALRQRSSFNVIHFESAFKIDVFVSDNSAYKKLVMARRISKKLSDSVDKSFWVVSPEDIVLMKLRWYHNGGRSSQRQWDDVLGILRIQGEKLDFEYLRKWSAILEMNELLEDAVSESR